MGYYNEDHQDCMDKSESVILLQRIEEHDHTPTFVVQGVTFPIPLFPNILCLCFDAKHHWHHTAPGADFSWIGCAFVKR